MKKIIMAAGENSQTILLGILVIICIIIVLNMISFFYKKYKNSHFNKNDLTNQIFDEDQSQLYVLVRTKDFKVLFISSRFQEVFHIAKERIVVDVQVLKEMVEESVYRDFMKKYQSWNQENSFKYSFKIKDVDQWFVLTVSAIENGKYHLFAFYDHSEDVLKEKDYLKQIETTKNESEYKASFLSRMSHEIRTPMNGIIGMLTLARNTQDTKQEDYYLQQAQDISQYLLSLINEVLDMSRMEAGKLELENKPFNIYHLEPQLNNIFKETIEKKDVMFKIEYFDFDVKYFVGDELRIMQILVNLLSNASKFTEKGEIKVTFRQMYKEDQVANIMMRVHDTGKGMSREFLSHIFRPFEQEGVEISKKYGGSGLGMAITDQLVKLMGGEIVVDSLEDKGTDFTVFLNLPVAPSQEYEDEKEKFFKDYYGTQGASAIYSPCDILTIKYNKLLNNRKEIIETKGITSRKYMDKEISNHKFDLIKDVNFTNSYFAYVPTTELAPLPLYRRLKLDPYEMATTIISLIIEASDFPLKLTLEFEKDSVRYKRYVHLFDALNDIQDQLECYMALEGITMTRLAKEIGFPKYAYNNIFARIIKFNDFKQLTDMVGAKIKITFTPQIIKTYSSCKLMFEKMLSNIDDMVFKNDQCKESIKYQLFCSIIREAPELAIVESLIELEQLRRSSNLALFSQKDVDIFEESKKKEADSK